MSACVFRLKRLREVVEHLWRQMIDPRSCLAPAAGREATTQLIRPGFVVQRRPHTDQITTARQGR